MERSNGGTKCLPKNKNDKHYSRKEQIRFRIMITTNKNKNWECICIEEQFHLGRRKRSEAC